MRGLLFTVLLTVAGFAAAGAERSSQAGRPIVILVSIDGGRWDYLERFAPPALTRLAEAGARAAGLIPIFPSKTFPNHYTIVTGLHAARHGITSNNMVDPYLPGRFALSRRDVLQDTRWWGGEPVWVTAERQGLVAATMFWPGSESEIAGDRPTYWRPFDESVSNDARVDQLLTWLDRPDPERPTFLTVYFDELDTASHDFGPESPAARDALLNIDTSIARLVAGVDRLGLGPRTSYVVVSDHGMAALSPDRVIVLDDYLDLATVDVLDTAPIVGLVARDGTPVDAIRDALEGKHPALAVYTPATLPDPLGLREHPRLPDVIGIADDGWHVTTRARHARDTASGTFPGGNHGYDPAHRSMHGLFVASGPAFQRGVVVPAFGNIHVYAMLCRVLGLEPASHDGDVAVTSALLR